MLLIGGGGILVLLLITVLPSLIALVVPHFHGTPYDEPRAVEDFTLPRADGGTFRLSEARGKVVALYFGYTSCPDVCPTTMYDLHRALEILGDDAGDVVVVFVTIDPEVDTPEQLSAYLSAFDERFIGLTAAPEQLRPVYDRFSVRVLEEEETAGSYGLAHSSSVYVVDRSGQLRVRMHFGASPEDIADDLSILLKERES